MDGVLKDTYTGIIDIIAEIASGYPDKIALKHQNQTMTYGALHQAMWRVASDIRAKSTDQKVCIGICMEKSIDIVVAILGVLSAGCSFVVLEPHLPIHRITTMVDASQIAWVMSQNDYAYKFEKKDVVLFRYEQYQHENIQCDLKQIGSSFQSEDIAYIAFTSGTTGKPKGVPITHKNLMSLLRSAWEIFDFAFTDTWTLFHSLSFDFSIWELFCSLSTGATLIIIPYYVSRDPKAFYQILLEQHVTVLNQTPSAFKLLDAYDAEHAGVGSKLALRYLFLGGEKLDCDILETWSLRYNLDQVRVYNLYGPTENTVVATYHRIAAKDLTKKESVIGQPIPSTKIILMNCQLKPTRVGEIGEICVGGLALTPGYLNASPEYNAHFFTYEGERYYATGDLGKLTDDGIVFVDRKDDQIKLKGHRIEPQEIVHTIKNHLGVGDAIIRKHPEENTLIAYISPNLMPGTYEEIKRVSAAEYDSYYLDLYNEVYKTTNTFEDEFHIIGWNSSYTKKPIAEEDMREWVNTTLSKIRAYHPQHILEIGFGTGMLLLNLHEECQTYCAVDYSQSAHHYLEEILKKKSKHNVELILAAADEFERIPQRKYDTIIINSVVVCMPDIAYLTKILRYYAEHFLADDGIVFIGDIRNNELLESFHASVLATQHPTLNKNILLGKLSHQIILDKDLAVSPQYFKAVLNSLPMLTHSHVELRRGCRDNELTCFRYDAVLFRSKKITRIDIKWVQTTECSLNEIEALCKKNNLFFGVKNIKNQRFITVNAVMMWLKSEAIEDGSSWDSYQRMDANIDDSQRIHPESLCDIAQKYGYWLNMCWSESGGNGNFDAVFIKQDVLSEIRYPIDYQSEKIKEDDKKLFEFSNEYSKSICQFIAKHMKHHLESHLPNYMIPNYYFILQSFPQTLSSKIDIRTLPLPDVHAIDYGKKILPISKNEFILQNIWSILFKKDKESISTSDHFFDHGGDSILAAKLMFLSRKEGIYLNIQDIFENPTIASLSKVIDHISLSHEISHCTMPEITPDSNQLPLLPSHSVYSIEKHVSQIIIYLLKPKQTLFSANLETICRHLLQRHHALRIGFVKQSEQWVQKILPVDTLSHVLEVVDFAMETASESALEIKVKAHYECLLKDMDTQSDQLPCRFVLYQLPTQQRFFVAIDHICCDQLSLNLFWKEFHMLLMGEKLPPLDLTYAVLVDRFVSQMQQKMWENDRLFWLTQLQKIQPLKKSASEKLLDPEQQGKGWKYFGISGQSWLDILFQVKTSPVQIHDVFLTAFIETLCEYHQIDGLGLSLLYHNRRVLDAMSFTMGAFVSAFPIYIAHAKTNNYIKAIEHTRDILNTFIEKGSIFSFYIDKFMRFLMEESKGQMTVFPKVVFNYLGRKEIDYPIWEEFPNEEQTTLLTRINHDIYRGNPMSFNDGRFMLFCKTDIQNNINFTLIYDPLYFSERSIEEFTTQFLDKLKAICLHISRTDAMNQNLLTIL